MVFLAYYLFVMCYDEYMQAKTGESLKYDQLMVNELMIPIQILFLIIPIVLTIYICKLTR